MDDWLNDSVRIRCTAPLPNGAECGFVHSPSTMFEHIMLKHMSRAESALVASWKCSCGAYFNSTLYMIKHRKDTVGLGRHLITKAALDWDANSPVPPNYERAYRKCFDLLQGCRPYVPDYAVCGNCQGPLNQPRTHPYAQPQQVLHRPQGPHHHHQQGNAAPMNQNGLSWMQQGQAAQPQGHYRQQQGNAMPMNQNGMPWEQQMQAPQGHRLQQQDYNAPYPDQCQNDPMTYQNGGHYPRSPFPQEDEYLHTPRTPRYSPTPRTPRFTTNQATDEDDCVIVEPHWTPEHPQGAFPQHHHQAQGHAVQPPCCPQTARYHQQAVQRLPPLPVPPLPPLRRPEGDAPQAQGGRRSVPPEAARQSRAQVRPLQPYIPPYRRQGEDGAPQQLLRDVPHGGQEQGPDLLTMMAAQRAGRVNLQQSSSSGRDLRNHYPQHGGRYCGEQPPPMTVMDNFRALEEVGENFHEERERRGRSMTRAQDRTGNQGQRRSQSRSAREQEMARERQRSRSTSRYQHEHDDRDTSNRRESASPPRREGATTPFRGRGRSYAPAGMSVDGIPTTPRSRSIGRQGGQSPARWESAGQGERLGGNDEPWRNGRNSAAGGGQPGGQQPWRQRSKSTGRQGNQSPGRWDPAGEALQRTPWRGTGQAEDRPWRNRSQSRGRQGGQGPGNQPWRQRPQSRGGQDDQGAGGRPPWRQRPQSRGPQGDQGAGERPPWKQGPPSRGPQGDQGAGGRAPWRQRPQSRGGQDDQAQRDQNGPGAQNELPPWRQKRPRRESPGAEDNASAQGSSTEATRTDSTERREAQAEPTPAAPLAQEQPTAGTSSDTAPTERSTERETAPEIEILDNPTDLVLPPVRDVHMEIPDMWASSSNSRVAENEQIPTRPRDTSSRSTYRPKEYAEEVNFFGRPKSRKATMTIPPLELPAPTPKAAADSATTTTESASTPKAATDSDASTTERSATLRAPSTSAKESTSAIPPTCSSAESTCSSTTTAESTSTKVSTRAQKTKISVPPLRMNLRKRKEVSEEKPLLREMVLRSRHLIKEEDKPPLIEGTRPNRRKGGGKIVVSSTTPAQPPPEQNIEVFDVDDVDLVLSSRPKRKRTEDPCSSTSNSQQVQAEEDIDVVVVDDDDDVAVITTTQPPATDKQNGRSSSVQTTTQTSLQGPSSSPISKTATEDMLNAGNSSAHPTTPESLQGPPSSSIAKIATMDKLNAGSSSAHPTTSSGFQGPSTLTSTTHTLFDGSLSKMPKPEENNLLCQMARRVLRDLEKKTVEKNKIPEKVEKVATVDKVPEKVVTVDKVPEKVATVDEVPEKVATVDKIPEKVATVYKIPEKVSIAGSPIIKKPSQPRPPKRTLMGRGERTWSRSPRSSDEEN